MNEKQAKTMYVARLTMNLISLIEVVKETDKTVSYRVDGSPRIWRKNKVSTHEIVFATWCEAHAHLIAHARQRIFNARANLRYAEYSLEKIENMIKNP